VIPIEHGAGLVAGDAHGDPLRHASVHQRPALGTPATPRDDIVIKLDLADVRHAPTPEGERQMPHPSRVLLEVTAARGFVVLFQVRLDLLNPDVIDPRKYRKAGCDPSLSLLLEDLGCLRCPLSDRARDTGTFANWSTV